MSLSLEAWGRAALHGLHDNHSMNGKIEYTNEFGEWYVPLDESVQDAIIATGDDLEREGPGRGRPLVDTIQRSRHANMKELPPVAGHIRILFAFDPRRTAILLIGGDKSGQWNRGNQHMISLADRIDDDHLEALKQEGR